jgi:hypothetical protein
MNVNLHIDRLVLEGLAVGPGQKRSLQTALQAELANLIAESGLTPSLSGGGAIPETSVPTIHFTDGHNPTHLGTQIARSVHQGLVNDPAAKR